MERPIIFSAPMVRALLREIEQPGAGKTQTRRLAWRGGDPADVMVDAKPTPWQKVQPGGVLWVRENFKILEPISGSGASRQVRYCVDPNWDDPPAKTGHWDSKPRGAIHLPRWACRILLDVTAVKVERLQDISEEDARAEGTREPTLRDLGGQLRQAAWSEMQVFARLWNHIHGADAWDRNPEVVAITFKPRHAQEPKQ